MLRDLERREPDAQEFVRPQSRHADIAVRFAPTPGAADPADQPLSVDLMLRPTVRHPPLADVLTEGNRSAIHLKIVRDDGTPTDLLHVDGHTSIEETRQIEKLIWSALDQPG